MSFKDTRARTSGRFARSATLLVAAAVLLSATACGRRGNPEAPPSASVLSTDDAGNVVNDGQRAPDRPFVLDPLLD